jgi:hypothetical protein
VRTSHTRNTRARRQRQLDDPPLLCDRPTSANTAPRATSLIHDNIVKRKLAPKPEGNTTF